MVGLTQSDIDAIAATTWGESRGESRQGQEAVVDVILNRMASPRFPSTARGVVMQSSQFDILTGPDRAVPSSLRGLTPEERLSALQSAIPDVSRTILSGWIGSRAQGLPAHVGLAVNYANPRTSDRHNLEGWIEPMQARARVGDPNHAEIGNHVFGIADPGTAPPPGYEVSLDPAQPGLVTAVGRSLQEGVRGVDVADIQAALNAMGFQAGPVDGRFGPQTSRAVAAAQAALGMEPTATVTPQTAAAFGFAIANIGLDPISPTPTARADVPALGQAGLPDVVDPSLMSPAPAMGQRSAVGFGTAPGFDFDVPGLDRASPAQSPLAGLDFSVSNQSMFGQPELASPLSRADAPQVAGVLDQPGFVPDAFSGPLGMQVEGPLGMSQQAAQALGMFDPSPSLGFAQQLGASVDSVPEVAAGLFQGLQDRHGNLTEPGMLDLANTVGMGFGPDQIDPMGWSPAFGPGTARGTPEVAGVLDQPGFTPGIASRGAMASSGFSADAPALGGLDLSEPLGIMGGRASVGTGFDAPAQQDLSVAEPAAIQGGWAEAMGLSPEARGTIGLNAPASLGPGQTDALGLSPEAVGGPLGLSAPGALGMGRTDALGLSPEAVGSISPDTPSALGMGRSAAMGLGPEARGSISLSSPTGIQDTAAQAGLSNIDAPAQADLSMAEPMGIQGAQAGALGLSPEAIGTISLSDPMGIADPHANAPSFGPTARGSIDLSPSTPDPTPSVDWGALASARHDIAPTMDIALGIPSTQTLAGMTPAAPATAAPSVAGLLDTPGFTPDISAPTAPAAPEAPVAPAVATSATPSSVTPDAVVADAIEAGLFDATPMDVQTAALATTPPATPAPAPSPVPDPVTAVTPAVTPDVQQTPAVAQPATPPATPQAPPQAPPAVQAPVAPVQTMMAPPPAPIQQAIPQQPAMQPGFASGPLGMSPSAAFGQAFSSAGNFAVSQGLENAVAAQAMGAPMSQQFGAFWGGVEANLPSTGWAAETAIAQASHQAGKAAQAGGFAQSVGGGFGGGVSTGTHGGFNAGGFNMNPGQGNIGADPDSAQGFATGQGAGSAGSKVLCSAFEKWGWLPTKLRRAEHVYTLRHFSERERAGYRRWARPLIRLMEKHEWLRRPVFATLTRPWCEETAYRLTGGRVGRSTLYSRFVLAAYPRINRAFVALFTDDELADEYFQPASLLGERGRG